MEQYKHIPASLKQLNQWVCFKLVYNEKKGKYDKIPKDPKTGYNAKANDPATWSDFQTAVMAVSKYVFDGIGIQFANGIFGVDLDDVVKDGKLTPEAQDIIRTLDSYTEYSPAVPAYIYFAKVPYRQRTGARAILKCIQKGGFLQ